MHIILSREYSIQNLSVRHLNLPSYDICPNRHTVQRFGCASINIISKKACHLVPIMRTYTVNRTHVDLCLQVCGDLPMCSSQMDCLMFYQAFGVNLMWYVCCWRGLRIIYLGTALPIYMYGMHI